MWRHLGHVAGDVGEDRDVAQCAHDAAWPNRVADRHVHAVAGRDLDVPLPGVHPADGDGGDAKVGARQGFAALHGALDRQVGSFTFDQERA